MKTLDIAKEIFKKSMVFKFYFGKQVIGITN